MMSGTLALVVLTFAGVDAEKPDQMDDIHNSMRISEATLNAPIVNSGEKVTVRYVVQCYSKQSLQVPKTTNGQRWLGGRQHWIERLGNDPAISAMPTKIKREGRRYGAGGSSIPTDDKKPADNLLQPKDKFSFEQVIDTKGFPLGKYRYAIQYRTMSEKVLQEWTLEFEVK